MNDVWLTMPPFIKVTLQPLVIFITSDGELDRQEKMMAEGATHTSKTTVSK